MSVKTLESYQEFTADGSTTYFTFNFNYVDSSEIIVGMRTGDNQYTVVDPVSYVLTKNASTDGGKIRFVTTKPCEDPDDPTCGDYIDNPPPAGTIVRIERKTVQSSTADWYVGLDMNALVGLFDKLFRISQENSDKFKNTIQTFPTQQGITVRELLSEHDKKIFYWNNEKQWLDITDFTIDDVVRQTDVGDILEQANAYSDEQNALLENRINGKFTAINAQIDANADAIQKTREDYIQADSEIHQILNAHASELTTQRNDIDGLGDQVSAIEEKIPGDASATNQLATKADIPDIDLDGYVKKSGDTMTGDLVFDVVARGYNIVFQDSYSTGSVIKRITSPHQTQGLIFSEHKNGTVNMQFSMIADGFFMPRGNRLLGSTTYPWENIYAKKLNNGADLAIPTEGGTLARIEDLQDVRDDYMAADADLQTQINGQATAIAGKQDELIAGDNIVISGNVISATGAGGGAGFDIVVVQELPATGQKGIIYLLAKDGTAPDVYDEYVWIEATQTFELIGTTQVDLTDYAKKEELDNYLPLSGGTLTGILNFDYNSGAYGTENLITFPAHNGSLNVIRTGQGGAGLIIEIPTTGGGGGGRYRLSGSVFAPDDSNGVKNLGFGSGRWATVFATRLCSTSGYSGFNELIIPDKAGTLARIEDIDAIGGDGTAGQVLTKTDDGMAWQDAAGGESLPDQTGNADKVLTTDGTNASWTDMPGLIIRRL